MGKRKTVAEYLQENLRGNATHEATAAIVGAVGEMEERLEALERWGRKKGAFRRAKAAGGPPPASDAAAPGADASGAPPAA